MTGVRLLRAAITALILACGGLTAEARHHHHAMAEKAAAPASRSSKNTTSSSHHGRRHPASLAAPTKSPHAVRLVHQGHQAGLETAHRRSRPSAKAGYRARDTNTQKALPPPTSTKAKGFNWPVENKDSEHKSSTEGVGPKDPENEQETVENHESLPNESDLQGLNRAYTLYDAGVNHRLSGNYSIAFSELREAQQLFHVHNLKQSPLESYAFLELGQAADEAGSYDLARHSYQECLTLAPQSLRARLNLARLEAKHGDFSAALKEARLASTQAPASPEAHLIVSRLLEKAGESDEARAEKERASDLSGKKVAPDAEQ